MSNPIVNNNTKIKWGVIIHFHKDATYAMLATKFFFEKGNNRDVAIFDTRDQARDAARMVRKNFQRVFRATPSKVEVNVSVVPGNHS